MARPIGKQRFRQQTKISRTGQRMCGLGLELGSGLMQVDLLRPEFECPPGWTAPGCELLRRHAEDVGVERHRGVYIRNRQNQMIQSFNGWCHFGIVPCLTRF